MKTPSELPFDQLYVGMKLISALKSPGKISKLTPEIPGKLSSPRWDTIEIDWDNGRKSTVFHMLADKIFIDDGEVS